MSFEQYSPLDTTLPFFSNQISLQIRAINDPFVLPILLKFKGIARRIRISLLPASGADDYLNVYFNNDLENPSRFGNGNGEIVRTYEKWITHLRLVSESSNPQHIVIEYDIVPVQYLPPRTRVG